jgi:hypothetical protein
MLPHTCKLTAINCVFNTNRYLKQETCLCVSKRHTPCCTRRHVLLSCKKYETCLLVQQVYMSSRSNNILFVLFDSRQKTCLLVAQIDISSCRTIRLRSRWTTKTCLLVEREDISSCCTSRHAFLLDERTSLLVEQEDFNKKTLSCCLKKHIK